MYDIGSRFDILFTFNYNSYLAPLGKDIMYIYIHIYYVRIVDDVISEISSSETKPSSSNHFNFSGEIFGFYRNNR